MRHWSVLGLAIVVGCAGAARGSLRPESEVATSAGESDLAFPDEAAARHELPASREVLAAEALLADARPLEAQRALESIVASTPSDLRARLDLGLAFELQGDANGAERTYRAALEVQRAFPEALNNLGALLRDAGHVDEAVALLREAVTLRPGFGSAQLNLGLALEDVGDDEGAERAYRTVIRIAPREPSSRTSLGLLLLRRGRRDEALIELRRAAPLASERADLSAIGAGLRRAGDPAMAVRVLRQAIEADGAPAPGGIRAELALAEFASGHRDVAEAQLRVLATDYPSANYLLGNVLAAREAWAEAATAYEAYLRVEPNGDDAREARGRLEFVRARR